MRILFVTNNYSPYAGGVVSSINATIKELQRQGHEVFLVAPDFLGKKHDDPDWVARIPSFTRFRYKTNYMAISWRPTYYLKKIISLFNPDIVHVHHPFLFGPIAQRLAKKRGIKIVFTYHTIYERYVHYMPLPEFILRPIVKRLVLSFCKKVDQIIVPSLAIQHYLADNNILHTNLIPSGMKEQFAMQSFIKRSMKAPYQLLYVGRFAREKNITALLDVMKLLPDSFYLTLVGHGPYAAYLKKYAYEAGLIAFNRVQFVINPSQEMLLDFYKKADLFLFSSQTDTQGLVITEAMAFSVPVISFDGPGQRDSITGENGFIVAGIDEMVQKILWVSYHPKEYADMQIAAFQTARKYYVLPLVTRLQKVYCADQ